MSFVSLAIGIGSAVVGGIASNRAAKKGAQAVGDASDASIAEQRRQFDLARADQQPWLQAGTQALERQNAFLSGDWSGFQNSPDYKFAVDQGFKGLDRGAAAGGNLWGGGTDADRIGLGQGLATQYANNYWNKLAGQAGQGQQSASNLGQMGMGMASNIGNSLGNAANARASSYATQGNNYGQMAGAIGGGFNNWYQGRQAGNVGGYGAFTPNQGGYGGYGTLGPSNGNAWNFGGG